MSIIKRICLVSQEAKGNTCWYFKMVGKGIDLALYTWVVVKGIAVDIIEFRGIPLKGKTLK